MENDKNASNSLQYHHLFDRNIQADSQRQCLQENIHSVDRLLALSLLPKGEKRRIIRQFLASAWVWLKKNWLVSLPFGPTIMSLIWSKYSKWKVEISLPENDLQKISHTIINIYAPNIGAPQYVRQMLTRIKGEINNNTIIVGDFNTPLTPMDRSTKQKINKETQTLNDTMVQLDLIDIYRTFHPKTINFNFFSSAHGIVSRIDHILCYKSSLGKFKKLKSFQSSFLTTMQ